VDADKSVTKDHVLEYISIKAWTIARCISFVALDVNIEALPIQLYTCLHPNINRIVHKLIEWWREDESPIAQGAPMEDLNKKSCTTEESLQN
jgi:hypothetical protein